MRKRKQAAGERIRRPVKTNLIVKRTMVVLLVDRNTIWRSDVLTIETDSSSICNDNQPRIRTTPLYKIKHLMSLGYCVQPLQPGKKISPNGWRLAEVAFPSNKQVADWWQYTTQYGLYRNVCIVTGLLSGGLSVRDFDGQKGEDLYQQWRDRFPDLALTLPQVRTKDGYHVYARLSFEPRSNKDKDEVRTPGGELICGERVTAPTTFLDACDFEYSWIVDPVSVDLLPRLSPEQLMLPPDYESRTASGVSSVIRRPMASKRSMVSMGHVPLDDECGWHGSWRSETICCNSVRNTRPNGLAASTSTARHL